MPLEKTVPAVANPSARKTTYAFIDSPPLNFLRGFAAIRNLARRSLGEVGPKSAMPLPLVFFPGAESGDDGGDLFLGVLDYFGLAGNRFPPCQAVLALRSALADLQPVRRQLGVHPYFKGQAAAHHGGFQVVT